MSDHDSCREKVCVVCLRKGVKNKFERNKKLSELDVKLIRKHVHQNFNANDPDYPCGLCPTCYIHLRKKEKGEHEVKLHIKEFTPDRTQLLRSSDLCNCTICNIVREDSFEKQPLNRKSKKKKGRPSKQQNVKENIKVCSLCFTTIYVGCRHSCTPYRYRDQKLNNVEILISSPSKTTSERLASRAINECDPNVGLKTYGPKPKPVTPKSVPKKLFSLDDMCLIRKDLNLSARMTLTLAQDLRKAADFKSRHVIEPNFKKKMVEETHKIDHFFELETISFAKTTVKKDGTKILENEDQLVVVTKDISQLIDEVIDLRKLDVNNVVIRVGMDGGGGFLKVCLSLFELSSFVTSLTSSTKFKDSGVKKALIIGIAPETEELYSNVKKLWLRIGLQNLDRSYVIATDMKLCNILLGMMNHSSMHPCCGCNINKNNLDKKGVQRTFHSLNDLFWDYFDSRASKENAKDYGNVIHLPVIENIDQSSPVINVVPPPELHLLIGVVNHIYDGMSKFWPDSESWLKSCYVKKPDYHGGQIEGGGCRKLLLNVNKLRDICPEKHKRFVVALEAFNDVVTACFSSNLCPNYVEKIGRFRNAYFDTKLSVTPKVHAVFYHIKEFCSMKGMGLGPWSEQTSESLHHAFKDCWENYLIKDNTHVSYGDRLLAAVRMFNNLNV